jgi:hypothetical protein
MPDDPQQVLGTLLFRNAVEARYRRWPLNAGRHQGCSVNVGADSGPEGQQTDCGGVQTAGSIPIVKEGQCITNATNDHPMVSLPSFLCRSYKTPQISLE